MHDRDSLGFSSLVGTQRRGVANLESGLSLNEYLDCFPDVTREQAVAVLEYAQKLTLQPAA